MPSASPARSAARSRVLAQRRYQPALRVEPADVDVAQVQMMDGDIAGHGQAVALGCPHHGHALGGREPAEMHVHAGAADEREDRRERDGLGRRRNRRQAQARGDFAVVRDAAPGEIGVLRAQPHAVAEGRGVLHRAQQHARVRQRRLRLRERDATRLGKLAHLGELDALEADGQRADREDVRLVERARAMLQHLDQARLVERGIGIRRTGETRHASRHGRVHLGFERGLVFETRLAQPRGEIDQTRTDDHPPRLEHAIGAPAGRRRAHCDHRTGRDVERRDAIDPVLRVDHAAVVDLDLHAAARRRLRSNGHCIGRRIQLPARMLNTAIRTAMPNVTCGRMTLRAPSATAESISTPRFIGPGCITIASRFASASFSAVSP